MVRLSVASTRAEIREVAEKLGDEIPETAVEIRNMARIVSVSFVVITGFVVLACIAIMATGGKRA